MKLLAGHLQPTRCELQIDGETVTLIAERVTVLRDGRVVASHPTNELQPVDMARLMVGRDVAKLYPDRHAEAAQETILEIEDFSVPASRNMRRSS